MIKKEVTLETVTSLLFVNYSNAALMALEIESSKESWSSGSVTPVVADDSVVAVLLSVVVTSLEQAVMPNKKSITTIKNPTFFILCPATIRRNNNV